MKTDPLNESGNVNASDFTLNRRGYSLITAPLCGCAAHLYAEYNRPP